MYVEKTGKGTTILYHDSATPNKTGSALRLLGLRVLQMIWRIGAGVSFCAYIIHTDDRGLDFLVFGKTCFCSFMPCSLFLLGKVGVFHSFFCHDAQAFYQVINCS